MSYRKKTRAEQVIWSQCFAESADLIEQSGIPDFVFADEDTWFDYLDHGYSEDYETGLVFKTEGLSILQKASLLRFITRYPIYMTQFVGFPLIRDLLDEIENRHQPNKHS